MMVTRDRSIALVGCIQFAWWAHRLAQHGEFEQHRLQLAAQSITCTDPADALDVYGGSVDNLADGIDVTLCLLGRQKSEAFTGQEAAWLTGYVGQLLKLGATLLSDSRAMGRLASSLESVEISAEAPVTELATIYSDNISPLSPRIMIQGNGMYLRNETFAAGIRTHLLAAIRSAVLWRQCGGRLWHLIFQRKAYLKEIMRLQSGTGG